MKNDDTTPAIRLTRLIQRHEQDRECFFKHDLDDLDSVKHRLNWLLTEEMHGPFIEERHGHVTDAMFHTLDRLEKKWDEYQHRQRFLKANFDPSQPRVPGGNSDGGQWTDSGGGSGRPSSVTGESIRNALREGIDRARSRGPVAGTRVAENVEARADATSAASENRPAFGYRVQKALERVDNAQVPKQLRQPTDSATKRRAAAIYGETAGITPQLKDPKAGPYKPSNYDSQSAQQLALARAYIGIVSERNPRVHFAIPKDSFNVIESRVWSDAVDAATARESQHKLDERVTNFFLRQEGIGDQRPQTWPKSLKVIFSLGPFEKAGEGGDVPRGKKTYIDFYGQEKREEEKK